ncbi:unnamed protein product, partial [Iphiclides podalirius]
METQLYDAINEKVARLQEARGERAGERSGERSGERWGERLGERQGERPSERSAEAAGRGALEALRRHSRQIAARRARRVQVLLSPARPR